MILMPWRLALCSEIVKTRHYWIPFTAGVCNHEIEISVGKILVYDFSHKQEKPSIGLDRGPQPFYDENLFVKDQSQMRGVFTPTTYF